MKNILITGSVMNSNKALIDVYEQLIELCIENNCIVSSPLDTMKFVGTDEEKYIRAMQLINSADYVIAEMSIPSTGQGMELQQAIIQNIPILVIAKKESKISGLIKGSNGVIDILYYDSIEEIKECIKDYLLKLNEK